MGRKNNMFTKGKWEVYKSRPHDPDSWEYEISVGNIVIAHDLNKHTADHIVDMHNKWEAFEAMKEALEFTEAWLRNDTNLTQMENELSMNSPLHSVKQALKLARGMMSKNCITTKYRKQRKKEKANRKENKREHPIPSVEGRMVSSYTVEQTRPKPKPDGLSPARRAFQYVDGRDYFAEQEAKAVAKNINPD